MKRILIADDRLEIVESIKSMLQRLCEVDTATTGLDILMMFKNNVYDGLIIDVAFETGMSGLEIAARLRAKHSDLPILVFSATNYSDGIRQQAIDIGASFREKPLLLEDIRKIMGI
jgi:CheY-like chemotaxis protein